MCKEGIEFESVIKDFGLVDTEKYAKEHRSCIRNIIRATTYFQSNRSRTTITLGKRR